MTKEEHFETSLEKDNGENKSKGLWDGVPKGGAERLKARLPMLGEDPSEQREQTVDMVLASHRGKLLRALKAKRNNAEKKSLQEARRTHGCNSIPLIKVGGIFSIHCKTIYEALIACDLPNFTEVNCSQN